MIIIKRVKRKHKYNARQTIVDGITFDSKTESEYYKHLKYLQSINVVRSFYLQPILQLIPSFKYDGKTIRRMDYKLDFKVEYMNGITEYVDVKGMATTDAKIKLKLARYFNPDKKITWICKSRRYGDSYGWIEYDELQRIRRTRKK